MTIRPHDRSNAWFDLARSVEPLRQGDLLLGVTLEAGRPPLDLVILTQSCDLEAHEGRQPKVNVLLAPCYRLGDWLAARPEYYKGASEGRGPLEGMRQGHSPDKYFLPPCITSSDTRLHSTRVVDFQALTSQPFADVANWVADGHRELTLRSPYREHFGQAVARYFMRIGLPIDIARFHFRVVGEAERREFEVGQRLWEDGPSLRQTLGVQVTPVANEGSGDTLIIAKLPDGRVIGCGDNPEQALQSLSLRLKDGYERLAAEPHSVSSEWSWLRALF